MLHLWGEIWMSRLHTKFCETSEYKRPIRAYPLGDFYKISGLWWWREQVWYRENNNCAFPPKFFVVKIYVEIQTRFSL